MFLLLTSLACTGSLAPPSGGPADTAGTTDTSETGAPDAPRHTDDALWTLHNDTDTARAGRTVVARRMDAGSLRVAVSMHEDPLDAGGVVLLSQTPWSTQMSEHTVLRGAPGQHAGLSLAMLDLQGVPELVVPVTDGPSHALIWVPMDTATSGALDRYPQTDVPMELGEVASGLHAADVTGTGSDELLVTLHGIDRTGVLVLQADDHWAPTAGVWWQAGADSALAHREGFAAADVDGDGVTDAIMGDMTRGDPGQPRGAVDVVLGGDLSARTLPQDADATIEHHAPGSFGFAVTAADLDGDGRPELVATDPEAEHGAGVVYLLDPLEAGDTAHAHGRAVGPDAGLLLGVSVTLCHLDTDPLILVGTHDAAQDQAAVLSLEPGQGVLSVQTTWVSDQAGMAAGSGLACGDFVGDGGETLLSGADGLDQGAGGALLLAL